MVASVDVFVAQARAWARDFSAPRSFRESWLTARYVEISLNMSLRRAFMTIDLKPEQQRLIDLAVRSGAYHNAGEVLDQAFEIIREQLYQAAGHHAVTSAVLDGYPIPQLCDCLPPGNRSVAGGRGVAWQARS
jgi:hypothetical protein